MSLDALQVPATLNSLGAVRAYVAAAAEQAGIGKSPAYRLRLAVDEIVTNIVTHGHNGGDDAGLVRVWAERGEQALTVVVEDTGRAYEPAALSPDDLDLPPEEREIGGLGLFLAQHNVDEFRYERLDDRNRHTFVVMLHPDQGREGRT